MEGCQAEACTACSKEMGMVLSFSKGSGVEEIRGMTRAINSPLLTSTAACGLPILKMLWTTDRRISCGGGENEIE